jgi:hypothetical protein
VLALPSVIGPHDADLHDAVLADAGAGGLQIEEGEGA